MLRHRRLLHIMHALALTGALLMVVAPLVSRWIQSQPATAPLRQLAEVCTRGGMHWVVVGPGRTMLDARRDEAMAAMGMEPARMDHADHGLPPSDHDGMVCDYCLLAARLLPFVLALVLLPLLQAAVALLPVPGVLPHLAAVWRAHAARGPPGFPVV